jgi:chloride channel 3/4/5
LLGGLGKPRIRIADGTATPKPRLSRHQSATGSLRAMRHHSRNGSLGQRLVAAITTERHMHRDYAREGKGDGDSDDRVWYDQFTSTDWVHDSIADAFRLKELQARKDFRGRVKAYLDGTQGWILSAIVGMITALVAYMVDTSEAPAFDLKDGYCSKGWYRSERVSLAIISRRDITDPYDRAAARRVELAMHGIPGHNSSQFLGSTRSGPNSLSTFAW